MIVQTSKPPASIEHEDALGDVSGLVERQPAAADLGQAVADQLAVVAPQPVAALAPDNQDQDLLARRFELADLPPGLAQDRRR